MPERRPSEARSNRRLRPLDHLRPGENRSGEQQPENRPPTDPDLELASGQATQSPAGAEPREHLEGSEQGPA